VAERVQVEVLERGGIYFAFRPRVDVGSPAGIDDVQRFYMILSPREEKRYRLIVFGQKKLPAVEDGGERYWAFVEKVSRKADAITAELVAETHETKTRGERTRPAARPVGEGVYALVRHGDHTHLAYVLELPSTLQDVQRALNIREEASYVISVKNPDQPSPRGVGLGEHQEADFPKRLQDRFKNRRFISVDRPEFLNYEGAELLFIGAAGDVSAELGIELDAEHETADTAEVFTDLRLDRAQHPTTPLLTGEWA
jgi:hypothetical protein